MKTVTHVAWFTHSIDTIGIIILENAMKEKRAYIGVGHGFDSTMDIKKIADYGAKFPLEAAELIMKEKGQKVNYLITND